MPPSQVHPVVVAVCKHSDRHRLCVLELGKLMGPCMLQLERSVEGLRVPVLLRRVLPDELLQDFQRMFSAT